MGGNLYTVVDHVSVGWTRINRERIVYTQIELTSRSIGSLGIMSDVLVYQRLRTRLRI